MDGAQVRAVMRKTAKVTAKRMLARYMGKATPNGMDPAAAAKLSIKVRMGILAHVLVTRVVSAAVCDGSCSSALCLTLLHNRRSGKKCDYGSCSSGA